MCHSAYDANASWHTWQAKASPSGRWRFVPPKRLSIIIILLMSNNVFAREQISNLVTPVSYFIDHISQLKKIKSNLIKYKQSSLVGVSGIGKTQIARMYTSLT